MVTTVIKVPDIGEGVKEVEIVEWLVRIGDVVNEDDVVGSVMTDKAAVEIPAPVSGVIVELRGEIGDILPVGTVMVTIESDAQCSEQAGNSEMESDNVGNVEPRPEQIEGTVKANQSDSAALASEARIKHITPDALIAPDRAHRGDRRPLASPAVRQRARDTGVDLKLVAGTGPGGRITQRDLDSYVEGTSPTANRGRRIPNTRVEEIKIVGMRRQIAKRMQLAKHRIPHFSYVEEVDVSSLEELRAELNRARRVDQPKLTLLPFIIKAMARAIEKFPQMNARFDDDNELLRRYGGVHVGIATQTDSGLMVPVLRHVESLDIWETSREIRRLADSARDGTVRRDELTGSTITVTSLGALGGIVTTPVINYPEVAILGVNRIVTRPMWLDDAVVPRQIMNLSASFDHRVVDGMDSAQFIQSIRSMLEHPTLMFMEEA